MPPDINNVIKMEVGIEDCLHIEFEYNKSKCVGITTLSLTCQVPPEGRHRRQDLLSARADQDQAHGAVNHSEGDDRHSCVRCLAVRLRAALFGARFASLFVSPLRSVADSLSAQSVQRANHGTRVRADRQEPETVTKHECATDRSGAADSTG